MVTKHASSHYVSIRGLRYHYRQWDVAANELAPEEAALKEAARSDAPATNAATTNAATTVGARGPSTPLVLLHGWMDVGASFQFMVDALNVPRRVIALDWRGFGLTDWAAADSYWFPDYLADLDALLHSVSPAAPVDLVGHSMGGNVACLYAGIRPARVRRLVNLEGFGLSAQPAALAVARYGRWLDEVGQTQRLRDYTDFAALADRLRRDNPRLSADRAAWLARHWAQELPDGTVRLRADPAHKRINPVRYRLDEAIACWQAVRAPVLWVDGVDSLTPGQLQLSPQDLAERRARFHNLCWHAIADCGHMLHHDQPEARADLLQGFLAD